MTDEELKEIEARTAAATSGPWLAFFDQVKTNQFSREKICDVVGPFEMSDPDVTFIVAARKDVPALCAEVRRLRGLVEALGGGK